MLIVPNTWIFQEINGMTMRVIQGMAKLIWILRRKYGSRVTLNAQKMDCNSRKFKGLPQ